MLEANVEGVVDVISHLSGMPDCSVTLNERAVAVGGARGLQGAPSGSGGV